MRWISASRTSRGVRKPGCRSASCRRGLVLVEDRDRVALRRELVGGREAGRPPPITATFLPVERPGPGEPSLLAIAYSPRKCSTELMPTWSSDLVAVAAGLAGRRADAAHHRGNGWLGQPAPGVFLPGPSPACRRADRRFRCRARCSGSRGCPRRGAGTLAGRRGLDVVGHLCDQLAWKIWSASA